MCVCKRKTWKGEKTEGNSLKRRERSGTYLTRVCSQPWSVENPERAGKKNWSIQPALLLSSVLL